MKTIGETLLAALLEAVWNAWNEPPPHPAGRTGQNWHAASGLGRPR